MFKRIFKRITTLLLCAFFLFSCASCELTFAGKKPEEGQVHVAEGEVKLYFDGNGATAGEMPTLSLKVGETVTLPKNEFSKENYAFAGWALEQAGEIVYEEQDSYAQEVAGEYTLFAVWEEGVTLNFELNAGEYSLIGYKGKAHRVVIPAVYNGHPVISIGGEAFKNATFLKEIVVEEGILALANQAFEGCTSLSKISFPDSLLSVSAGAIQDTAYYKNENNWDAGVLYVGNHLLKADSSVSGVYTIKEGTRSIGAKAFCDAKNLSGLVIPQSVTSFDRGALDGTAFYNHALNWENNVLYVGDYLIKAQPGLSGSYTVKEGTKRIAMGAFSGCHNLEEISLPASLTAVGASAFVGSGIKSARFENGLTVLGRKAFINCKNLASVSLPQSLIEVQTSAFNGCEKLESIQLPSGLTKIGPGAFSGCALTEIQIPQGVRRIEAETFSSCPLEEIQIPDAVTHIGHSAFYNTRLIKIQIPQSVNDIGAYAFSFNADLQTATVGDGVEKLGAGAFYGCQNIQKIIFGEGLKKIGSFAFGGCLNLQEIAVAENNSVYKSVQGDLYLKDGKTLVQYAVGKIQTSFALPGGVEEIARQAFEGATTLQNVTLNSELKKIGNYAFAGSGLTTAVVPDSVQAVGLQAFNGCVALESVWIGNGVTELAEGVFGGCVALSSVSLGESMKTIQASAFNGAQKLISFSVASENESFKEADGNLYSKDGKILIKYAVGKEQNSFVVPEGVEHVSDYAFYGAKNVTSVKLSSTVTEIGENAFRGCENLETVTLNDALEKIGDYAFYDSGLKRMELGENVRVIGDYAFFYCRNLSEVDLGENVTSIGAWAFGWCGKLSEIILPKTVASLGERVFYFCFDLTVYCSAEEQPAGWSQDWNFNNCPVVWGY